MPMAARSPHEHHRAATPLELFFDLVFVVAIARAAAGFHHAVSQNHVVHGLEGFAMVFFAIWWAWMNFTWFASAYDCDDVLYRVLVFVQMTGALVLAAGIPGMFEARAPNLATIGGYVIMRLAMVAQWLRAAHADPPRRVTARRYAIGITVMQCAWISILILPINALVAFLVFAVLELAVPAWAEQAAQTTWHPHHIAERYSLLTLIVLGECVLSATVAIESTLASGTHLIELLPLIFGGLLIMYAMWWIYFDRPMQHMLATLRKAMVWGYGHYFVFAAVAAVGAALAASVDSATHHAAIGSTGAGLAVTIPVVVYLMTLWILHYRPGEGRTRWIGPVAAPLILLTSASGHAVLLTGLILAGIVAIKIVIGRRVVN